MIPAMFCGHANEVPCVCSCPCNCYCRVVGSCRSVVSEAVSDYSADECVMFRSLGLGHLLNRLDPVALYRHAVSYCFLNNKSGLAVETLRLVASAILGGKVYRCSPEFDELFSSAK